eukprot:4486815-Amphidinium_carterae.1
MSGRRGNEWSLCYDCMLSLGNRGGFADFHCKSHLGYFLTSCAGARKLPKQGSRVTCCSAGAGSTQQYLA